MISPALASRVPFKMNDSRPANLPPRKKKIWILAGLNNPPATPFYFAYTQAQAHSYPLEPSARPPDDFWVGHRSGRLLPIVLTVHISIINSVYLPWY